MLDFKGAISRSSEQFKGCLESELKGVLKGEFVIAEGVTTDNFAKQLDILAGIDIWHIDQLRGMRGVALRIQTGYKNWHTFTVRGKRDSGVKTEYQKRLEAIENNYLYPYLTVQAYVTPKTELIACAIVKTIDLIAMVSSGNCELRKTGKGQIGQAEFYVVDWYAMKNYGYKVVIKPDIDN